MKISDWITLCAVLVALFGPYTWKWVNNCIKKKQIRAIMKTNFEQLRSDLVRIRDKRNTVRKDNDNVHFDKTSISEVGGYSFLFTDLLLPNTTDLKLSKYPSTITFFNHYRINIETIKSRYTEGSQTGWLTLRTVNNLLSRLEKAINEFG